jgi:hypothetical protein
MKRLRISITALADHVDTLKKNAVSGSDIVLLKKKIAALEQEIVGLKKK